ncbi:hypothetical protein MUG78_17290 [Gordonia alkaliphila]|uniref:hypothetical protein n=1 Tax=Gordonia alkaliphila TaxID=1053547 RepID=UPI001FF33DD9|nr:hypothetical protein [Gordonia alkaliphila]MCK0441156.1 hypothetical protein [Gordonia alkaliphila]
MSSIQRIPKRKLSNFRALPAHRQLIDDIARQSGLANRTDYLLAAIATVSGHAELLPTKLQNSDFTADQLIYRAGNAPAVDPQPGPDRVQVNFRALPADLRLIETIAQRAQMTRNDYILAALATASGCAALMPEKLQPRYQEVIDYPKTG